MCSRGAVVDKFGDAIQCCAKIMDNGWRKRHDTVKMHITAEVTLASVPVDCEVYNLFGDLLPAALEEEGGELQWTRDRQGKVPNFKFLLNTPEGPVPCLAELKVINAGKSLFPRGEKGLGVERRARKLITEYVEGTSSVFTARPPWCADS